MYRVFLEVRVYIWLYPLTIKALTYFCKKHEEKGLFQLEFIINILVSFFWFIWIPMLWIYGHYKYYNSFSVGTVFIRQNLTSTDVRLWRIKTVPAVKGINTKRLANIALLLGQRRRRWARIKAALAKCFCWVERWASYVCAYSHVYRWLPWITEIVPKMN